jgi:hypothetical protein
MNKATELQVIYKRVFFKRLSFWLFILVVINLFVFFAFTQNFYLQKYYAFSLENINLNQMKLFESSKSITAEVNKVNKIATLTYEEDCSYIEKLNSIGEFNEIKTLETQKLNLLVKVKQLSTILNSYYSEIEKVNNNILVYNSEVQDYNTFKLANKNLVNICYNYYNLITYPYYVPNDYNIMTKIQTQLNSIESNKSSTNAYLQSVFKSINQFKSKNFVLEERLAAKSSYDSKSQTKTEFIAAVKKIILSLLDTKLLVTSLSTIVFNGDISSNYKQQLLEASETPSADFVNNILKITL